MKMRGFMNKFATFSVRLKFKILSLIPKMKVGHPLAQHIELMAWVII